jgi:predicted acetyltransferase
MPVVDNLMQLYAHDFSEFHHVELDSDGRFNYAPLPLYWSDRSRHPFLVKMDGRLAGFVLVQRNETSWDMVEFFVLRGCRRRGAGTAIAHEVWKRFPGMWEVRVMQANRSALPFWERAVSAFTGQRIQPIGVEKDGNSWWVFTFESTVNHANALT